MNNKKINSHFIQKAFARSWANANGDIQWLKQGTNSFGKFNIEDDSWRQPISKKGYYSNDVEHGMNLLENLGMKLIKKMEKDINTITIEKEELIILKYYLLLSDIRVPLYRKSIEVLNGNKFFNIIMKHTNLSPKKTQEKLITFLIDSFLKYYKNHQSPFFSEKNKKIKKLVQSAVESRLSLYELLIKIADKSNTEDIIRIYLNMALKGELAFIRFESGNLLLMESNSFQEISSKNHIIPLYSFHALTPKLGVVVIYGTMLTRIAHQKKANTKIFHFQLEEVVQTIHEHQDEINGVYKIFLDKKHKEFPNPTCSQLAKFKSEFEHSYIGKLYSDHDKFIYTIHNESRKVANVCNAMRLPHNNEGIIIYCNIKNYNYAILTAEWLDIYEMKEISK